MREFMKLSEHVYQITGKAYGINSNVYAINTEAGVVLIDSGYAEKQFEAIEKGLHYWGLSLDDVIDVILTHCHFDHAGNAARLRSLGKRILIGEKDAEAVETGNAFVASYFSGTPFTPCKIDCRLQAGDILDYGDVKLTVLDMEGHTRGAIGLLLESAKERILFAQDLFEIAGVTPAEEMQINLCWMDGKDFNGKRYKDTLWNLKELNVDFIAVGHGPVYYGDSREIISRVYQQTLDTIG